MTRRKHPRWNGDPAVCAYCLLPNDRRHALNHNGTTPTRCTRCMGNEPRPALAESERAHITEMLARPTWWAA